MWPSFVATIVQKITEAVLDTQEDICSSCGTEWSIIGCPQHVLFTCPFVQPCAMESWHKHGPGTRTGILCGKKQWAHIVRSMSSNPYKVVTGLDIAVRFAYFDSLVEKY